MRQARAKRDVVQPPQLNDTKADADRLTAVNEQLKKAIAERSRAKSPIRLIIDTIPVMAWSVRPDGIVDFLNQGWMDYTGLSLGQYVADPTGPIHPDDTPRVLERWRAQMARDETYDDEMRLRRADGTYRQFLVRTAPLRDQSGRVVKWFGVSTDIEDRKRAEAELEESLSQLRALTASLLRAQDDERRRIAQKLHETTAQDLAAVKMLLGQLGRTMVMSDADRTLLAEGIHLIDGSIADVRTLSYLLHPPFLDENGLLDALRWYAKGFADRSGIALDLKLPARFERLPQDVESALFRVVQEALTNIHRHARSATARIRLRAERGCLALEITDRGRGMPADVLASVTSGSSAPGVGLAGMRERLQQLGGALHIESNDHGTTLRATVPLPEHLSQLARDRLGK
jgi:PAS domain S-box-containing protein